jgi:hypothetical protein
MNTRAVVDLAFFRKKTCLLDLGFGNFIPSIVNFITYSLCGLFKALDYTSRRSDPMNTY